MMKISISLLCFAYVALGLGVLTHKFSVLAFKPALGLFALGLLISIVLAIVLALGVIASVAGFDLLKLGQVGVNWPLLLILFVALVPAMALRLMVGDGFSAPAIHDISTDTDRPVVFLKAQALRKPGENSLDLPGDGVREKQRAYYDLSPLVVNASPKEIYGHARQLAETLGWHVHYDDPDNMQFEAVESTAFFGFNDDIAVRVYAAEGGGAVVQMRSVSRVGVSDLSANAMRIRSFLRQLKETQN